MKAKEIAKLLLEHPKDGLEHVWDELVIYSELTAGNELKWSPVNNLYMREGEFLLTVDCDMSCYECLLKGEIKAGALAEKLLEHPEFDVYFVWYDEAGYSDKQTINIVFHFKEIFHLSVDCTMNPDYMIAGARSSDPPFFSSDDCYDHGPRVLRS